MSILSEAFSAIAGGGITGLLGTGVQAGISYFQEKQRQEHELAMAEMDLKTMAAEAEHKFQTAQVETAAASFQASIGADKATYSAGLSDLPTAGKMLLAIVDFLRGTVRPIITYVGMGFLFWSAARSTGTDIYNDVVNAGLYASVTAIVWWFGSRYMDKRGQNSG